jgi:hypothetical protein
MHKNNPREMRRRTHSLERDGAEDTASPAQEEGLVRRESEMLDVQLLDVLAQIEALLRSAREIQRSALQLRGAMGPVSASSRQATASDICEKVKEMVAECAELTPLLRDLKGSAEQIQRTVRDGAED